MSDEDAIADYPFIAEVLELSSSLAEWMDAAKARGHSQQVIAATMGWAAQCLIGEDGPPADVH